MAAAADADEAEPHFGTDLEAHAGYALPGRACILGSARQSRAERGQPGEAQQVAAGSRQIVVVHGYLQIRWITRMSALPLARQMTSRKSA